MLAPMQGANRYSDTNFITGMRAFAALGVVVIHTGGLWFREWGAVGNRFADLGASGVYVFFVISGFAVSHSFERDRSYGAYLKKRLNRIVPLYFFWLAVCAVLIGLPALGWYSAFMHLTFLSFLDYRVANSIIGVEWTIPIEVFFYLIIPFVLMWVRSLAALSLITSAAFLGHRTIYDWLSVSGIENGLLALHWSPIPYASCFLLGVIAYRIRSQWKSNGRIASLVFLVSVAVVAAFVVRPDLFAHRWIDTLAVVSFLTFAVVATGVDSSKVMALALRNPISQYLGKISYGLYLAHYPIFRWFIEPLDVGPTWAFFLTALLAMAVSSLTWISIERIQLWRSRPADLLA
jgi:peptidoglycan/LPS O-acetylase OafA/YrhL